MNVKSRMYSFQKFGEEVELESGRNIILNEDIIPWLDLCESNENISEEDFLKLSYEYIEDTESYIMRYEDITLEIVYCRKNQAYCLWDFDKGILLFSHESLRVVTRTAIVLIYGIVSRIKFN